MSSPAPKRYYLLCQAGTYDITGAPCSTGYEMFAGAGFYSAGTPPPVPAPASPSVQTQQWQEPLP